MKIHIDTLLQKMEDIQKRCLLDIAEKDSKLREINRDKQRIEELLTFKEAEIDSLKQCNTEVESKLIREKRRSQELEIQVETIKHQVT